MVVPCKGCTDRRDLCHSKCERYKQYREEIDEARKKRQESIYTDATIRKLRYNRLKKMRVIGRKA